MDPVAYTAYWVAAARARESMRPDALFHDPFAAALAGDEGELWSRTPEAAWGDAYVAVRTRFFDEELLRATIGEGVRQVVLVAAGLDARAYRLGWPAGTTVFELDRPEVLAHKEATLAALGVMPRCTRVSLAGDVTVPWEGRIEHAGFRRSERSAWLVEGLTSYLREADVRRLLERAAALAAPGSSLALDLVGPSVPSTPEWASFVETARERGIELRFTCADPKALLEECGWSAEPFTTSEVARRHGRELPGPADGLRSWLVSAKRRAGRR